MQTRPRRWAGVIALVALAGTGCTDRHGDDAVDASAAEAGLATTGDAVPAPLPESDPLTIPALGSDAAVPEATAATATATVTELTTGAATEGAPSEPPDAPPELPADVELHEPELIVRLDRTVVPDDLRTVRQLGATHVAAVGALQAEGEGPQTTTELDLLAVDVDDVRPLTPDVTAQAVGVWERLLEGDAVVRHDVAHELGLELGGTLTLRTVSGTVPVRVGAFAANGAPPLAEVLVPRDVGALLGVDGSNTMIVAAAGDPGVLAESIRSALGGDVERRNPPPEQRSRPKTTGDVTLEPFRYTSRGDGTIVIDPQWVQRHIVTVELPGLGTTRCHRVMVPQLMAALEEVADAGLYDHFRREQFAGCFMPRHILWDPSRGLSMHAWGLAIDFNSIDNAFGRRPVMDPRIVEIFERWGFEWGGRWSTPDGMHFQLARIVEP